MLLRVRLRPHLARMGVERALRPRNLQQVPPAFLLSANANKRQYQPQSVNGSDTYEYDSTLQVYIFLLASHIALTCVPGASRCTRAQKLLEKRYVLGNTRVGGASRGGNEERNVPDGPYRSKLGIDIQRTGRMFHGIAPRDRSHRRTRASKRVAYSSASACASIRGTPCRDGRPSHSKTSLRRRG